MALYGKAGSGGGGDFEPCPEGPQRLVCVDVVDMGMQDVTWQGQTKRQHKIQIRWQSEYETKDSKPFLLIARYTLSMHEKANLRKTLESWRGRKFASDAEAENFDIEAVIGASAFANIVHNKSGDKTYANLQSIMPMPKGMEKLTPRDYERVCERPGYVPPAAPVAAEPSEVDDFHAASNAEDVGF